MRLGGPIRTGTSARHACSRIGRLTDVVPLDPSFTWPDVEATLTPLAYRPGPTPGLIAPTYPPGLPLHDGSRSRGGTSWFTWLLPLLGVLTVWLTFPLGAALGEPIAGALAALWLSLSTTFLFQLFQPMSDVPAAACWLSAWCLATRPGRLDLPAAAGARGLDRDPGSAEPRARSQV